MQKRLALKNGTSQDLVVIVVVAVVKSYSLSMWIIDDVVVSPPLHPSLVFIKNSFGLCVATGLQNRSFVAVLRFYTKL